MTAARTQRSARFASLVALALGALAGCAPCGGCPTDKACVVPVEGAPEVCFDRCDPANSRPCPADRTCVSYMGSPTCARNP